MQKLNAKNIERVLKNKTKDFEVTPPDYLWNQVAQSIPDYTDSAAAVSGANWLLTSSVAFTILLNIWLLVDVESSNNFSIQPEQDQSIVLNKHEVEPNLVYPIYLDTLGHHATSTFKKNLIGAKSEDNTKELIDTSVNAVVQYDMQEIEGLQVDFTNPVGLSNKIRMVSPTKPKLSNDRWSYNLSYLYYYADRVITARNVQNGAYIAKMRNEYDKQDRAFQMRLTARYEVSRSISISAGIAYGRWNESFGLMSAPRGLELDSAAMRSGHHPDHLHKPGKEKVHRNQYRQFEIPVMVHHQARLRNRLSLVNSLGFSVVWQELEKGTQCYDFRINHFAPTQEFIRNQNLNFYFESALALRLNKQWQIEMGPSIRYTFFSHFNAAYPILQNNLGIGAQLSLRYYPSL